MKKILFLSFICLAVGLFVSTSQVQAAYTFEAHGTSSDGRPENGLAVFSFTDPYNLSITLNNTAGPSQLGGISSVLDGLQFSFSDSPTTFSLYSATAIGQVKVTRGNDPVFGDIPGGNTQPGPNPFGWTIKSDGGNWQLFAGDGSFEPYGIVNHNITNTDGIPNRKHNPYLDGPVTFSFNLTGLSAIPEVTSTEFYFGTRPDVQTGSPVPLPPSVYLLGTGLLGLVLVRKRVKK